ncbi:d-galactonate transporter [Novosphingobium nitrogenifigens DSM 19370]|uniref:D-galactonate transporter n=1 Tax=Novosphingobium nitrogenifigens DSM 19370 TaxID=983920 RepID=F1Z3Y4_9SPHN|nr:d-galactonate transporter [Novosphingobium nitrogenifigens DSM 19370]
MTTIPDEGRSAMRKAQWRIVPLVALGYLCAYMDRVNVGFAAVRMNADLGFSATVYGLGAGLFFLGYALFEIPSNLVAVRQGPRRWLARIMISWGIVSAAMMLVRTPMQFYAMRFLLGAAEAGFWPGLIYYFAMWFPVSHRGRAVSRFYVASPLASLVMGAMAGALLALDGMAGLRGWQWLLLVQGLPSVAVGFAFLRLLPDKPQTVDWLTQGEKAWIAGELAREAETLDAPPGHDVLAALRNPRVLGLAATGFFSSGVMTTLSLSAPLVLLGATGLDATRVGYLVSVGGVIGAVTMIAAGDWSDWRGDRFLNAFWMILAMAGALLMLALARSHAVAIVGYLGFAATCFTVNMLLSSGWADVMHPRERAVGAAAINMIANLGGFAMPYAWGAMRDATGAFTTGLVGLTFASLVAATLALVVRRSHAAQQAPR